MKLTREFLKDPENMEEMKQNYSLVLFDGKGEQTSNIKCILEIIMGKVKKEQYQRINQRGRWLDININQITSAYDSGGSQDRMRLMRDLADQGVGGSEDVVGLRGFQSRIQENIKLYRNAFWPSEVQGIDMTNAPSDNLSTPTKDESFVPPVEHSERFSNLDVSDSTPSQQSSEAEHSNWYSNLDVSDSDLIPSQQASDDRSQYANSVGGIEMNTEEEVLRDKLIAMKKEKELKDREERLKKSREQSALKQTKSRYLEIDESKKKGTKKQNLLNERMQNLLDSLLKG